MCLDFGKDTRDSQISCGQSQSQARGCFIISLSYHFPHTSSFLKAMSTRTPTASKKRKAEDEHAGVESSSSSAESGDADYAGPATSRTFPYCDDSGLESDGSDYDYDDDEEARAADPSWTRGNCPDGHIVLDHDPMGEVREPKVNMLFRLAVIQERWTEFVQHD